MDRRSKLEQQLASQAALIDAVESELAAVRTAVNAATAQAAQHATAVAAYERRLQETLTSEEVLLGGCACSTEVC